MLTGNTLRLAERRFGSAHAKAGAANGKWRSWHMVIWRNERPFTAYAAEDLGDWQEEKLSTPAGVPETRVKIIKIHDDEAIKHARSGRTRKPVGEKRVSR